MEFNSCAHLASNDDYKEVEQLYERLLKEGKDPAQFMLDMQNSLQEKLAEIYPDRAKKPKELSTVGEVHDWVSYQKKAIDDEFSELIRAIPGMSIDEKTASSVWKVWKKNYHDIRSKRMSELSNDDLLEMQFEKIDQDHFTMNIDLALNIDAKTRFILYCLKNAENIRRYQSGY